jgi:hypothetical protein
VNAGTKLSVYTLGLAATFGAAFGAGHAIGPLDAAPSNPAGQHGQHVVTPQSSGTTPADPTKPATFAIDRPVDAIDPGVETQLRFTITGPNGPVLAFEPQHEKELHLIVVSHDLAWFQHVHPTRDHSGQWSVPITFPKAGPYRMYADFAVAGGPKLVLDDDLTVRGSYDAAPLPPASNASETDGYQVGLRTKSGDTTVQFEISRHGQPVNDLQPYLGAYGHLVAIEADTLEYLHVHPEGQPGDGRTMPGPDVSFGVDLPHPSSYRLFLDFQHDGRVHTAAFTVNTTNQTTSAPEGDPATSTTPTTDAHGHSTH